jgi:hypothetical protein
MFTHKARIYIYIYIKSGIAHFMQLLVGLQGFDSGQELDFVRSIKFRSALGPFQCPVKWVPGILSPGVKRPEN